MRERVRAAEDDTGVEARCHDMRHCFSTERKARWRRNFDSRNVRHATAPKLRLECAASPERTFVVGGDDAEPAIAILQKPPRHHRSDSFVREAHHHIQRRLREIPSLDDGY